jgi:hypothetical protein
MLRGEATPTTEDHSGAVLFRVVSDLRRVLRRTILRGLPFAPLSPRPGSWPATATGTTRGPSGCA